MNCNVHLRRCEPQLKHVYALCLLARVCSAHTCDVHLCMCYPPSSHARTLCCCYIITRNLRWFNIPAAALPACVAGVLLCWWSGKVPRYSFVHSFGRLAKEQGLLALWRGNTPYLLRHVPSISMSFAFKVCRSNLKEWVATAATGPAQPALGDYVMAFHYVMASLLLQSYLECANSVWACAGTIESCAVAVWYDACGIMLLSTKGVCGRRGAVS